VIHIGRPVSNGTLPRHAGTARFLFEAMLVEVTGPQMLRLAIRFVNKFIPGCEVRPTSGTIMGR
jgi:hypothetical protein